MPSTAAVHFIWAWENTDENLMKMQREIWEVQHAATVRWAEHIAKESPKRHRDTPHPSNLWKSGGRAIPIPLEWRLSDKSFADRFAYRERGSKVTVQRLDTYVFIQVIAPNRSKYGKAASYVEYYSRDKARRPQGRALARGLNVAYGKPHWRVAHVVKSEGERAFDNEVASAVSAIKAKYREV